MNYCLNYSGYNIVAFPKCGCTQIIKLCTDTPEYSHMNHGYNHNKCSVHGTIHNCGNALRKEDPSLEYLLFYRFPHERIVSFYYGNACYHPTYKNMNLNDFIDNITENKLKEPVYKGHLSLISSFTPKNTCKYIHLSNLNKVWQDYFSIDINEFIIINKTEKRETLTLDQINLIKELYHDEYTFLDNIHEVKYTIS